jgi:hypothetical protein
MDARLVRLGIVRILTQDRCTVCAECTTGSKTILDTPDRTPLYVGHVESHFSPFRDSVNIGARLVPSLRQTYHRHRNRFGCTQWYSKVMRLKWKLDSVHLEIVLIMTLDRCTVCTERTMGSEIIFDAACGSPM